MQFRPQQWDTRLLEERLSKVWAYLSEPNALKRLQRVLLVALILWVLSSLVRVVWSLLPSQELQAPSAPPVNPIVASSSTQQAISVDLEAMVGLGLFAEPETQTEIAAADLQGSSSREGIESGARETRLDLTLQGILASTDDGLGSVIIEANRTQKQYAVGDKLPAAGQVSLAKVMPRQVVIDNNGTYELLSLFEDSELTRSLDKANAERARVPPPIERSPEVNAVSAPANSRGNIATQAAKYRAQLYDSPEQLADLVTIAAVRDDNGLRGYRVGPGKDSQQFRAFGFEAGDIVTAINGYTLSDPTNTMRLYQLMRNATEATFDIDRNGVTVSLSVSLNE